MRGRYESTSAGASSPEPVVIATCTALASAILLVAETAGNQEGPKQLQLTRDNVELLLQRVGLEPGAVGKGKSPKQKRPYRFGDLTRGFIKKVDRAVGALMDTITDIHKVRSQMMFILTIELLESPSIDRNAHVR